MPVKSKTAIVSGASQGIGAGVVQAFLDKGYNVVGSSRNATKTTALTASQYLALVDGDIGDFSTAKKITETAVARFGSIDVLINNAGLGYMAVIEEIKMEDMRHQFETKSSEFSASRKLFFRTCARVAADASL